jgi:hypothetical protein
MYAPVVPLVPLSEHRHINPIHAIQNSRSYNIHAIPRTIRVSPRADRDPTAFQRKWPLVCVHEGVDYDHLDQFPSPLVDRGRCTHFVDCREPPDSGSSVVRDGPDRGGRRSRDAGNSVPGTSRDFGGTHRPPRHAVPAGFRHKRDRALCARELPPGCYPGRATGILPVVPRIYGASFRFQAQ